MLTLCRLLFSSVLSLVRFRAALQAEILALRHQLQVLERSARVAGFACELPAGSSGFGCLADGGVGALVSESFNQQR